MWVRSIVAVAGAVSILIGYIPMKEPDKLLGARSGSANGTVVGAWADLMNGGEM